MILSIKIISNIIIIFLFCTLKIQSIKNVKLIYLGEDNYYIISSNKINFYKNKDNNNKMPILYSFNSNQKIRNEEEFNSIFFGKFNCIISVRNILIIKNYVYYLLNDEYFCNEQLNQIKGNMIELIPFDCIGIYCYYFVVFINNNKEINIYLFKKIINNCLDNSDLFSALTYNKIGSENFSCQLMKSTSDGQVLTCFYQKYNSNEIIASSFQVDLITKKIKNIPTLTSSKQINGAKIIKSKLSQNSKESYVCYINNDNNVDCLIYNIDTNKWNNNKNYLNNCLSTLDSLNFDYFDNSNEYFLYCYESSEKFNLMRLDENFDIINDFNNSYDLSEYLQENCENYYLSTLFYNLDNVNFLINCDNNFLIKSKNEIKLTQISLIYNISYSTYIFPTSLITNILTNSILVSNIPSTKLLISKTNIISTTILSFSLLPNIIKNNNIII